MANGNPSSSYNKDTCDHRTDKDQDEAFPERDVSKEGDKGSYHNPLGRHGKYPQLDVTHSSPLSVSGSDSIA